MGDEARAEFRFTDAEWRQYQAMPEQGYSHRGQLEFFVNRWQASRIPTSEDIQRGVDVALKEGLAGRTWPEYVRAVYDAVTGNPDTP